MATKGLAALLSIVTLSACNSSDENAEVRILSIQSSMVLCESVGQQLCLSVSGQNNLTAFFPFYNNIAGFDHQWGHSYTLTATVSKIKNPPADGSDRHYSLVSIDSETTDDPGTRYSYKQITLLENTFTKTEQQYAFLGQPFSCAQAVDCDALVSMSGSGGILDELIFSYTGDGNIQLESWL